MKRLVIVVIAFIFAFGATAQNMEIVPGLVSGVTGEEITVSVVVTGFDTDTTSLLAIEFYIDFDNTILSFTGASNFSALLPASQWIYSAPTPLLQRFSCNWAEPTLSNLNIPDGTSLFDLKFLCIAGESALEFDSAACVFVHIDGVNLITIPVEFTDGYVQIGVGVEEDEVIGKNFYVQHGNELIIRNLEGALTVTNLAGQHVLNQVLEGNFQHHFFIRQKGVMIITITNPEKRISGKVLIF